MTDKNKIDEYTAHLTNNKDTKWLLKEAFALADKYGHLFDNQKKGTTAKSCTTKTQGNEISSILLRGVLHENKNANIGDEALDIEKMMATVEAARMGVYKIYTSARFYQAQLKITMVSKQPIVFYMVGGSGIIGKKYKTMCLFLVQKRPTVWFEFRS